MDFQNYVSRQRKWSKQTFGTEQRTEGIMKHIEKEVNEVRECLKSIDQENDKLVIDLNKVKELHIECLYECIDIIILAIDAAWRMGFSSFEIEQALADKQIKNYRRKWPKDSDPNKPTEHIKEEQP